MEAKKRIEGSRMKLKEPFSMDHQPIELVDDVRGEICRGKRFAVTAGSDDHHLPPSVFRSSILT